MNESENYSETPWGSLDSYLRSFGSTMYHILKDHHMFVVLLPCESLTLSTFMRNAAVFIFVTKHFPANLRGILNTLS